MRHAHCRREYAIAAIHVPHELATMTRVFSKDARSERAFLRIVRVSTDMCDRILPKMKFCVTPRTKRHIAFLTKHLWILAAMVKCGLTGPSAPRNSIGSQVLHWQRRHAQLWCFAVLLYRKLVRLWGQIRHDHGHLPLAAVASLMRWKREKKPSFFEFIVEFHSNFPSLNPASFPVTRH